MTWINSSPRSSTPPLEAFKIKAPLASAWLIPDRATGDFLDWLNRNPNSARKKLEDCQVATFALADLPAALAALQADPYVASASVSPEYQLHSVELIDAGIVPESEDPLGGETQYGIYDMNVDRAWQWASGYALIGQIDIGLFEQHVGLRQFNGNSYAGGNFIKTASRDVGLTAQPPQSSFDSTNVDEKKAMYISDTACTATPGFLLPANLGHGTHVAGLLAANGTSGLGLQGTCQQCGISAWKAAFLECSHAFTPARIVPSFNDNASDRAKAQAVDAGVQALSMSFGAPSSGGVYDCKTAYRDYPMCQAIAYATGRDVAQVASSGNVKAELDFPASDKRVISAGGFVEGRAFWDDAPNCPPSPDSAQCGSNYSKSSNGTYYRTHQELLGSAKRVLSTTYPNTLHAAYAECGDGYGTPMGDGVGWCTGTSMSAPQIAGVVGLLRSINPLVPTGNPEPIAGEKAGLRTVLKQTASRAGAWDPKLGYGIPDAAAAARKMLGTVAGATVRNRATPLFRLWQATTKDFAETSSPQYALSLMINQDKKYVQPVSGTGKQPPIPGYAFPYDVDDPADPNDSFDTTPPATPRASIYVLTTEYRPRSEWPALIPLHLMDKDYPGGKDYLLATTKAEIESAYFGPDHVHCNNGHLDNDPTSTCAGDDYDLRTIQGYIYAPCTPESTCIPPGAVKLWRQYREADNDCAVFLDGEKSAFVAAGYIAACPISSTTMIGYAYPATDADGNGVIDADTDHDQDGLIDGFEYVVGTNPNAADSDGDGIPDATEFPLAGIATGDPCMDGPLGARNCGADIIFQNGFNP
ncbi:S8 family peptidase [Dokdonella ginsengisoli]|uniref:S8 family serine peptidase n=1 Tax=Dokdonella ginsengisoli TaxID=363846 RepID=A0ABV9QXN1_9GAMM